jgi:two-component system NtrC family sensor kinase
MNQTVELVRRPGTSEADALQEQLKKLQAAHATAISQYTAMINAVPAMAFLKDIEHRYIMVNEAFCANTKTRPEDIIGKTAAEVLGSSELAPNRELEDQAIHENRSISVPERRTVDSEGEERWASTTVVPVHNDQGQVSGVVGLIQDVTELHVSREQLVQADKMAAIGILAAGVAHEINNPVGFISSNLNTMAKYLAKLRAFIGASSGSDEDRLEAINDMLVDFGEAIEESLDGADRVKKIVADLKSFSRVDKARQEYYNLNEGLETTLNIVWNELKYKCTVQKNYGDIPDVYCISNQINQVFMNLLVNAGHAITGESGIITITTRADEGNIQVSIRDDGCGISRANLKRIFEPFFTTKQIGKGTGLGLSMAYDIIKKHDGRIDVQSEVGVGTEFVITLPVEGIKHGQEENSSGR